MPPARVPSATSRLSAASPATRWTDTFGGSWLACTAARTRAGVEPETPIGIGPVDALPAKAKPRMAAMAKGATSTGEHGRAVADAPAQLVGGDGPDQRSPSPTRRADRMASR